MSAEDYAQELELAEYVGTQQRAILPKGQSLSHCEDCGNRIPLARQQTLFVTRCVYCQEAFELDKKRNMA